MGSTISTNSVDSVNFFFNLGLLQFIFPFKAMLFLVSSVNLNTAQVILHVYLIKIFKAWSDKIKQQ